MTEVQKSAVDTVMYDAEFQQACQSYAHGNGSSGRIARAAIAAMPAASDQDKLEQAARDVLGERARQVSAEGWTAEHDDHHTSGELGLAAALYALPYESGVMEQDDFIRIDMLLEISFDWKLKPEQDRRRRLVKAGALIIAEIERMDRARQTGGAA